MDLTPYHFLSPHEALPEFVNREQDLVFHDALMQALRTGVAEAAALGAAFLLTGLPQQFPRLILMLYAPGNRRILITRPTPKGAEDFFQVFQRLLEHPRRAALVEGEFRLQMDFLDEAPWKVDFFSMGMEQLGERHFEIGLDGLLIQTPENKLLVFAPGDGYVRSVMGMGQLRDYLFKGYGEETLRQSSFRCFRSASFISTRSGWRALYRGHPVVGALTRDKLEQALRLAIEHIKRTQQADGRFLYYYDAALDSRRDHEHPKRDPDQNPYYNILRHGGGALTCLFHEKRTRRGDTWEHMTRALDYLVAQAKEQKYKGREGAYIYSEKKSKLGGSGIALYALAQFERTSSDKRYRAWADRLAWHLINQITASGEFIYYNIYLDQAISEGENANYFSFFYPGEAICGLAAYLHLLTPAKRRPIFKALHKALEFLLIERPILRASEYSAVPSDGWLMMGIMELWDFKEMQRPLYADFVFSDAQKMIDHMYKVTDAPYPDYAGGFYYNYGDYPYADGARCEGLLGAYELAVKMGNHEKAVELWKAMQLAAWALLHLVNTEDSLYFAPRPDIALGGIRFKYTRQWFRIDTIQHVASFFAKMLPYWDRHHPGPASP